MRMPYIQIPTNIILERSQMKHLFGKWWWDKRYKKLMKGDKKIKKAIDKSKRVWYNIDTTKERK